jgi:hypothetical protein
MTCTADVYMYFERTYIKITWLCYITMDGIQCVLKINPMYVFNKVNPIILGVQVLRGAAKVGDLVYVQAPENKSIKVGRAYCYY